MRVWIEITGLFTAICEFTFHPLMRVWIEIACFLVPLVTSKCFTLLWGCGLKYKDGFRKLLDKCFTLLWGCGLKYLLPVVGSRNYLFHPLMRVWIEIKVCTANNEYSISFTLLWGCGLKSMPLIATLHTREVSPSYEGVDWNAVYVYAFERRYRFTLLWGCGLKSIWRF